jgi:hypothetical protein
VQTTHEAGGTTLLTGDLQDQAALYGVLGKVRQLNLSLLSLESDAFPPPDAEPSPLSGRT